MAEHNDTGKWGEEAALRWLRKRGYTIRDCDWRLGHRDIDIVALTEDMRTVVFIEVKTRSNTSYTHPEDAIDKRKIRNLGLAANAYVKMNKITLDIRFDILTVVGMEGDENPVIEHWEDAFNPMLVY